MQRLAGSRHLSPLVDPTWLDRLVPPTEDEDGMLDVAFNLTETSRICCQIPLSDEIDGTINTVPGTRLSLFRFRRETRTRRARL